METITRVSQVYPLTDMLTGKTTYAVYTGEYDKRNPQRLIGGPELKHVFASREEAIQFAAGDSREEKP
jgi:hypothetical protein